MVKLLVKVAPHIYCKHITHNSKRRAILYVHLHKALCGLIQAALLFCHKLRKELEMYGFVVDPEDPCLANKWIPDGTHPIGGPHMTMI